MDILAYLQAADQELSRVTHAFATTATTAHPRQFTAAVMTMHVITDRIAKICADVTRQVDAIKLRNRRPAPDTKLDQEVAAARTRLHDAQMLVAHASRILHQTYVKINAVAHGQGGEP